jgi:outer membrane murein-binding lipoprotein Lpp
MKRAFVLCALVGVAVYATTAWSAAGPTPIEQRLSRDVNTLKANVSTLKSQVKTLQSQQKTLTKDLTTVGDVALGSFLFSVCSDEITADAFEGTWQIVDQISAALQAGKTYFGVQTPVTATLQGQDICASGNITRSQVLPPTVAQYQALLAPFHSSSALRASLLKLFARGVHLK